MANLHGFDDPKYRGNPKMIAEYLNVAVPSVPGEPIKALRILDMPRIFRAPHDEMSRMLEVEIGSESTKTTYVYICKTELGHTAVLELVNIQ